MTIVDDHLTLINRDTCITGKCLSVGTQLERCTVGRAVEGVRELILQATLALCIHSGNEVHHKGLALIEL